MRLYPQLLQRDAGMLAEGLAALPLSELVAHASVSHSRAIVGATGGQRVTVSEVQQLQRRVRECAASVGFLYDDPDATPPIERGHGAALDVALSRLLFAETGLSPHEASRSGVWAFFGCVLAPELVRWRFPGAEERTRTERFTGNRLRNLYGRLWWRAWLFNDPAAADPLWLVAALGEDELVQISERPNAAGYAPLARELGRQLVAVWHPELGTSRSELLRSVMKRLLRWMAITRFEVLPQPDIETLVSDLYVETIAGMGLASTRTPTPALAFGGWRGAAWQKLSLESRYAWIAALDDAALERLKALQNSTLPDWREYELRWRLLFQLDATLDEIVTRGGIPTGQSPEDLAAVRVGSWLREVNPGDGARLVSHLRLEDVERVFQAAGWQRTEDWSASTGQRKIRRSWNGSLSELLDAIGDSGVVHLVKMFLLETSGRDARAALVERLVDRRS